LQTQNKTFQTLSQFAHVSDRLTALSLDHYDSISSQYNAL